MKTILSLYLATVLMLSSCSTVSQQSVNHVKAYFSPPGKHLEEVVVEAIDNAKSQILVQAYGFSNDEICAALIRAKKDRKVKIKILLDKSNETSQKSCMEDMEKIHVTPRIDDEGGIAHNKVMIIDSMITISGSFNFTENAKRNEENLLVITDHDVAMEYIKNWYLRRIESRKPE